MKLSYDAAKAPYINFSIVRHSQYDLRGSVISALNVSVDRLIFQATWSKVYDFDARFIDFFQ